jgi:hypothetical protein
LATADDLQEAAILALEELRPDAESQGVYWKDASKGIRAHEPEITKNLKLLLRPRLQGFIVNAEVDCYAGRTDIQIEASVKNAVGEPHLLRCVIEAKPCDATDLTTAIENQLVRKYLGANRDVGVYLVLWFCAGGACRHAESEQIMEDLRNQAEKASRLVTVVHYHIKRTSKGSGGRGRMRLARRA